MSDLLLQKKTTQEAGEFVRSLQQNATSNGTFDSAASEDFISSAINQSGAKVPEPMQVLFDEFGDKKDQFGNSYRSKLTKAILDGIGEFERNHGVAPADDLLQYAMHMGYGTSDDARRRDAVLDSANSTHSDNYSLQPNRAVVAILSALSEGIPFAHYLPVDIGSNEAKLAIFSHLAGSNYGQFVQNDLMDGVVNGKAYITPSRIHATTNSSGAHTGQLTSAQTDHDTCTAVGGNVVAVKLQRGRTLVYVNGKIVARETSTSGSGTSTVSGSVTISGTSYAIAGTINTDTGAIAMTSTPALPDNTPFVVEGFIDYERQPELIPSVIVNADTYPLFAKEWRAYSQVTPGARSQMMNELAVDPLSEAFINIQTQYANERHYELIWKANRLSVNNTATFDMAWSTQGAQKTRAQIWQDFSATLGAVSQQMAIDTLGFGITHLYVGAYMKAQLEGLPRELFQPSGIAARPGIYRVGRLFGLYEVYYTPRGVTDSNSATQVLCVGRANDAARNPFVLGDVMPPNLIQLAVDTTLKQGSAFYCKGFTEVNPHGPSSSACAMISVSNMGL